MNSDQLIKLPRTLFMIFVLITIYGSRFIAQELDLKHTGGPMGGTVGDLTINASGTIFSGVYTNLFTPTGNYSGLFKSTDNGNSWEKIQTQFEDFEVYEIYITKKDHIWIGTNFQGRIYLSTDNGVTWQNKRNGYNSGECWAFGESNDGVLFAGDGQYSKLYKSIDYGDNWEFSINLRPLVFATNSNNIVYSGTRNGLFATTDNGVTWGQNSFLSHNPVASILIDSNNNIYCGTGYYDNGNGVFYSTDGGQNWTQLGLAGKVVLSLAFDSKGNLYAGTLRDGLYKTTDMGQTWLQYEDGIYQKQIFRLISNEDDDIFIGSENEGIFRSLNNETSFDQIGLPISKVNNIVFSGDSLIFSATPSGVQKFNRTTNLWSNIGLQGVEAITITPDDLLYAATLNEGLFKSIDLGQSWKSTNLTSDSVTEVYNVESFGNDTIVVSTDKNLHFSFNSGISWNVTPIKTSVFSRGLFFLDGLLFATGLGENGYSIYRSNNYGLSFNEVQSGFTAIFQNQFSGSVNGTLFICEPVTGRNVYKSNDFGLSWNVSLNKSCSSIFTSDNGLVLAAASNSDSIYISTNFGVNWTSTVHSLKKEERIFEIAKDNSGKIFMGSFGSGLYESEIVTDLKYIEEQFGYLLTQNYPNPFNPTTKIKYSIPKSDVVQIKIFDLLGAEIKTLLNEFKQAGQHEIEFDTRLSNSHISELPSGVYFYRIVSGSYSETKKMLFLK